MSAIAIWLRVAGIFFSGTAIGYGIAKKDSAPKLPPVQDESKDEPKQEPKEEPKEESQEKTE